MDKFTPEQTLRLITELGIDVVAETGTDWSCLCPFHGNINTPAFAVSKYNGTYYCFNLSCGSSGNMVNLIRALTDKNMFAALRMINRAKENAPVKLADVIKHRQSTEPLPTFPQDVLDRMRDRFWSTPRALDYMHNRAFNDNTLEHFGIGYASKKDVIGVPMHDVMGQPVGLIGRTIDGKRFENSPKLPKSRTLWNIHRAKRNEKGVICEASCDAMSVWQATGYDAMATLGSSFSEEQAEQVRKYFTHIVIFTDDDWDDFTFNPHCRKCRERGHDECIGHNTGLELGLKIADMCKGVVITWAHADSLKRFDGLKDANAMLKIDEGLIDYAVKNAIPHIEMTRAVRL